MSLIENVKEAMMSGGSSKGEETPNSNSKSRSYDIDCNQSFYGGPPPSITISSFWGVDDYISSADWIELYDSITSDYGYNELNKIIRLGGYLRKFALSWYVETIKHYNGQVEDIDWDILKDNFKKHFNLCNVMSQSSELSSNVSSIDR